MAEPNANELAYLNDPVALAQRICAEAERRNRDGEPLPELPPVDESAAHIPLAQPRTPAPAPARRVTWVRLVLLLAATVLLAVGLGVGFWLGSRPGAPEVVRPEPVPDASDPLTVTSEFELWREGPNGPVLAGVVGDTPVAARVGDTLVVRASTPRPVHWVVFARRPDGVVVPLLPARTGTGKTDGRTATVAGWHTVESAGEWLVASVSSEAEIRDSEARAIFDDADLRRPLGSDAALAYVGSTTVSTVMGTTQPPELKRAIDQFDRLCKRLSERVGGPVRAIVLPVSREP